MDPRNPFRPTFGSSPPTLVGRSNFVNLFLDGLERGPGAAARASLYTGQRGTGKTVMLNAVEDAARQHGWVAITETSNSGLVDRLTTDHLPRALADHAPDRLTRITGIDAPFGLGGATWTTAEAHRPVPSLRSQLTALTDALAEHGTGLVLTVDEIHGGNPDELRQLATTIQHLVREDREFAFAGAGLPDGVEQRLLHDPVLTFFRRADRHHLDALDRYDAAAALREPIEHGDRRITPDALDAAVELSAGYPYLVQVVGDLIWDHRPDELTITIDVVDAVRAPAIERIGRLVHQPSLAGLSDVDRRFLAAMSLDDGPTRIADVADRLTVDLNYANQYRRRLLATELVDSPQRGYVDFALPYLRDYVRGLDLDPAGPS